MNAGTAMPPAPQVLEGLTVLDLSTRLPGPLAAIGISGPVERLRPPQLKSFTPEVLRAAREISEALGYTAQ